MNNEIRRMSQSQRPWIESQRPWIEKYRPMQFDDIVLDSINRQLFHNIIAFDTFPHLLFYGPPGTGKTTTIINLIHEYQQKRNIQNNGNIIHLNASDERGIDIIRNQIYQFVSTKNMFDKGLKFVILDEVDYMTKTAQQALKELLLTQCTNGENIRFCLICNYISKIDTSLQHEFICVRFNQLPRKDIYDFIHNIARNENIELTENTFEKIHQMYGSDIRSMINFLQSGSTTTLVLSPPLHDGVFQELHTLFREKASPETIRSYVMNTCGEFQCDVRELLKYYFNYVLRNDNTIDVLKLLEHIEPIVHYQNTVPIQVLLSYFSCGMDLTLQL